MSTACGRPQGVEGVGPMWMHVDKRGGGQKPDFLWTSYMDGPLCPPIPPFLFNFTPILQDPPCFQMFLCSYIKFSSPYQNVTFPSPKLTKSFVSPLNDKFPP